MALLLCILYHLSMSSIAQEPDNNPEKWRGQWSYRGRVLDFLQRFDVHCEFVNLERPDGYFLEAMTSGTMPHCYYEKGTIWYENMPQGKVLITARVGNDRNTIEEYEQSKVFVLDPTHPQPLNFELNRILYLSSPQDTHFQGADFNPGPEDTPEFKGGPLRFAWEGIGEDITYRYRLVEHREKPQASEFVHRLVRAGSTSDHEITFNLTPSQNTYFFTLDAYANGTRVGYLYTTYRSRPEQGFSFKVK